MATYKRRQTPDQPVLITNVGVGDQINFKDVLGKNADKVQVYATAASDVVEYRINSMQVVRGNSSSVGGSTSFVSRAFDQSQIKKIWLKSDVFESTGQQFEVGEMLSVCSLEIVGLTLGTGTVIEIICW